MKKLFTLAVIACAFVFQQSSAQIQKGEKMLGARLSFLSSKVKGEGPFTANHEAKTRSVEIVPELGFGLGNNWIIGIGAGYSYLKQDDNASLYHVSKGILGGAFVRKFYPLGGGKFGLFGQGNVEYEHLKTEYRGSSDFKSKTDIIGVSVQPGAYVRATKRFIVEASIGGIGYSHSTAKPDGNYSSEDKTTMNAFTFSLTNQLALGFKIVL